MNSYTVIVSINWAMFAVAIATMLGVYFAFQKYFDSPTIRHNLISLAAGLAIAAAAYFAPLPSIMVCSCLCISGLIYRRVSL